MQAFDYGISIQEYSRRFPPLYSDLLHDELEPMGYPNQALTNGCRSRGIVLINLKLYNQSKHRRYYDSYGGLK
jgi:hypothetical protein